MKFKTFLAATAMSVVVFVGSATGLMASSSPKPIAIQLKFFMLPVVDRHGR